MKRIKLLIFNFKPFRYFFTSTKPIFLEYKPFNLPNGYSEPSLSNNSTIYVAMSGGVDSSVAAALMAQKYGVDRVCGVYMRNWSDESQCTEEEWKDVQSVAKHLGVNVKNINLEREYWLDVFEPMLESYKQGFTSNPDVACNRYIKFGSLKKKLDRLHKSDSPYWLVTGHYARLLIHNFSGEPHLFRPSYLLKDQSYFLSSVPSIFFQNVLFPLCNYTKLQVRKIAHEFGLSVANKPDSQGLCFVSQSHRRFKDFLAEYLPSKPGNIISEDGEILGKHDGLWTATVGQKSGICLPQGDSRFKGAWFVKEKRYDSNELVVVKGSNNPSLYTNVIKVSDFEWLGIKPNDMTNLSIQFRSLGGPHDIINCELNNSIMTIHMAEPQRAVAPGQNLVLYQQDRILGTGIIK